MGELLYCGDLEKWSNTARGKTWRKFFIRLTNREIRWHLPTEADQNVFLGEIEVSRIVNAKIDKTSALNEPDHCMFIVQDPQITHEFRTSSLEQSEHWVQHIKNATLPKTRRKKLPDTLGRDRIHSDTSNQSNISVKSTQDKPAMVTEIMGGTHICRPSDPSEGEQKTEKNTILIMNNIPERLKDSLRIRRAQSSDNIHLKVATEEVRPRPSSPRSMRSTSNSLKKNRYSFSLSTFYPFSPRPSVDSDTDLSEVPSDILNAPIVREGYLIKQGQKIKNWKRRWFTLSSSALTYREEESTAAKGIIYMAEVILARRSCKYPDKKFLFEVITKKRTYYMMASSQDEMTTWTDALTTILIPEIHNNCNNSDASSLSSS
ncbi:pleckstrin homology-like domain family B member 1 isoform X1 [Bolinopsis microptera]|uniref:pleckstrin homology-like domain family B member 1 isoform X1 n=1 Tax=Bolinopsis microptera TaxID=2820187 RepID=UPI00307A7945